MLRRTTAAVVAAALAVACGADPVPPSGDAPAVAEARAPAPPPPDSSVAPPAAAPAPEEPPCVGCAARPIVFVHGHGGSNSDYDAMIAALVAKDGRWTGHHEAGTGDHAAWPAKSIGRREWLFAFDYYVTQAPDARGSYTAGPGRIGSNALVPCATPLGAGGIVATKSAYDSGVTHDYAADFDAFVGDVLRATGASDVDVVAHSMGGLVVRSWLAFHGGRARTHRMLFLSSPHAGVPLATLEPVFGSAKGWMSDHELAELDSGTILSPVRFVRCGDFTLAEASWTKVLGDLESPATFPELYTMSGSKDLLVSESSARHPFSKEHVVVDGVDHPGILKADETIAHVEELLGW